MESNNNPGPLFILVGIVFFLALVSAAIAFASPADDCIEITEYARMVMTARQIGSPVEELYREAITDEQRRIVREAYKLPLRFSDPFKAREVDDFANSVFLACVEPKK